MDIQIINTTNETITILTKDGRFIEVKGEDSLGVDRVTSYSDWGLCSGYKLRGKVPAQVFGRFVIVDEAVLQFIDERDDFIVVRKAYGYFQRHVIKDATLPKVAGKRSKSCVKDVSFHARL